MKNIVIIPNPKKEKSFEVTKKLIAILNKHNCNCMMSDSFSDSFEGVSFKNDSELFLDAQVALVLGGDGTILKAAVSCAKRKIPILGINLGRVGFMTEVNVCDIEDCVKKLLFDDFVIQKRMMMDITLLSGGKKTREFHALNDVVVSKTHSPMITLQINSDGEKINEYKADGLIIATPTGSTGYSLSAGGPVADPTMELFIASPICAHMLHARCALLSGQKEIEIILKDDTVLAEITIDGEVCDKITNADRVIIKKSDLNADIIKIGNQSFYDVLIDKLR